MSKYKHGNWYCEPANMTEANEIIERAVASGAVNKTVWLNGRFYGVLMGLVGHYKVGTKYTIEELREKFPLPGEKAVINAEVDGSGLIVADTLKTPLSGVYKTLDCEDSPIKTPVIHLTCNLRTSTQVAMCADGSCYKRKTDFNSYWGEWIPMPQPKELNGKGLPTVGEDCEYSIVGSKYKTCTFVGINSRKSIVIENESGEFLTYHSHQIKFRPLHTERDQWIKATCEVFNSKCKFRYSGQHFTDAIGAIYDAIKSGDLKAPEAK